MASTGPLTKDTSTVALGLAQIRVGPSASNIATATSVLSSAASIGALANTKYTGNVEYWKLESGFPKLEDLTLPISVSAMLECAFKELTPYNLALAMGIDAGAEVSATVTEDVNTVTTSGTTTGSITVTDTAGPTTETWTVYFDSATTGVIVGSTTGHVHDIANLTSVQAPDNGGNPYFSIPANFFSGTWAADETYVFKTTAYSAAGASMYADNHTGTLNLGALSAPDYIRMEAVYTYPNATNHMYIIFPRANAISTVEIDLQAEDNANVPLTFEAKRADSGVSGGNAAWDDAPLGVIIFD